MNRRNPEINPEIIILSYFFPPDGLIGGARPHRFYKYLKRAGYTCHVITASDPGPVHAPDVHFVPDVLRATWESAGKKRLSLRGHIERLMRAAVFPGEMGILWSRDAAARAHAIILRNPGVRFVTVSSFPPLGVFFAAILITWRDRTRWISDFRDPMSIDPTMKSLPLRTRLAIRMLEAYGFRKADALIANVEGAAAIWRLKYPGAASRLHVIWNGYDPEETPEARPLPIRARKVWLHTGTLYEGRNPDLIVSSLTRLRREGNHLACSVEMVLVGDVNKTAELDQRIYQGPLAEGWLRFLPRVPRPDALKMTEEADGLLILQPQSEIQVPGKLFEYVCLGRPILALAPRNSAVAAILARSGVPSVCLHPDDDDAAADGKVLQFLAIEPGISSPSEWFRSSFDGAVQAAQLASIIQTIV